MKSNPMIEIHSGQTSGTNSCDTLQKPACRFHIMSLSAPPRNLTGRLSQSPQALR
uniref:Uncharacterized protein n=1 Tax=Anguilla anguilla TaxID=7936 RepID=A0A0E9UD19_ANGAN